MKADSANSNYVILEENGGAASGNSRSMSSDKNSNNGKNYDDSNDSSGNNGSNSNSNSQLSSVIISTGSARSSLLKDKDEVGLRDSIFSQRFSLFVNPSNTANLTTFLLLNTMIGSGILNQPFVFKTSGIWGGIAGMIVSGILIWTGLLCLTAAGIETNILEYSGLAKKAFGINGERVVDVAIIIVTFGSQLGYILIVGTSLADLLRQWGCRSEVCNDYWMTILSISIFTGPVCMLRHFGHLAYISLFSIAAIVAVLLLVIIGGPIKHETNGVGSKDYQYFNTLGLLQSIGSIVFSLDCASANLQAFISTEVKSQNMSTWKIISLCAVVMGGLMCIVMGLAGYLSFGESTEGMILDNFVQSGFDVFKIMVIVHLIFYIPSNFVIMRYSVVKLFSGKMSEKLDKTTHAIVTVFLLMICICTVLLILYCNIGNGEAFSLILNITGGIGGGLEAFILPASIYLKLMPSDSPLHKPAICLLVFGFLIMLSVLLSTIISF